MSEILFATGVLPVLIAVSTALLAMLAARRPDRAALLVAVVPALAITGVVLLALVLLGIGATPDAATGQTVATDPVVVPAGRRWAGLGAAAAFLALGGWLVRTGDWSRVDERA